MATCIVDVQDTIGGIPLPLPQTTSIHYKPTSDTNKGAENVGRTWDHVSTYLPEYFTKNWLSSLPENFRNLNLKDIHKTLVDLR